MRRRCRNGTHLDFNIVLNGKWLNSNWYRTILILFVGKITKSIHYNLIESSSNWVVLWATFRMKKFHLLQLQVTVTNNKMFKSLLFLTQGAKISNNVSLICPSIYPHPVTSWERCFTPFRYRLVTLWTLSSVQIEIPHIVALKFTIYDNVRRGKKT